MFKHVNLGDLNYKNSNFELEEESGRLRAELELQKLRSTIGEHAMLLSESAKELEEVRVRSLVGEL